MSDTEKSREEALVITVHQDLGQALRSELEADGRRTIVTNSVGPAQKLLKRGNITLAVLDEDSLQEAAARLGPLLRPIADENALLLVATREGRETVKGLEPADILDYPLDPGQFQDTLRQLDKKRRFKKDYHILGRSEAIRQIREIIAQIAPTPVNVLITGETGTGKTLIAEVIHRHSARTNRPFHTLNCGAIPETLLESELFGHERGAFTDARTQRQGVFEAADGGTVFLDEIGEMTLSAQVRLLRVLEAREITRLGSTRPISIDVRVIAATNQDLKQAVEEGRFRRDLYYRLRVVEIQIPPLRSRPEDLPILIDHFIGQTSREHGVPPIELDSPAIEMLQRHRWPGNIREIKNLIERLMVLSVSRTVGVPEIVRHLEDPGQPAPETGYTPNLPVHLGKTPEESHRDLLYWAILEVARDIKEIKAFLMGSRSEVRSLPVYQPQDTPFSEPGTEVEYDETDPPSGPEGVKTIHEVEKNAIARALQATGGHRKRAAELLDMAERTLYRKIQQYNL